MDSKPSSSRVDSSGIPHFSAASSMLTINTKSITRLTFASKIPHSAAEYDSIFTTLANFQDILRQKDMSCGTLWFDKGIYSLTKELQLYHPERLANTCTE